MENSCYENQHIMLKSNYNFATYVYSEVISHRYGMSFDKDEPFTTCICDSADNIQMKLIKKIGKHTKLQKLDINWNIYYNVLNGSYIKHIELNKEQPYIIYNGLFMTYNPINNKLINGKMDLHLDLINKIDITMNFNKLYDIVERNGTKYIFSIELTHICYSKFRNNFTYLFDKSTDDGDSTYKKMDILLHSFNYKFNNVFTQLILDLIGKENETESNLIDLIDNDTYIHGIYKCNMSVYDDSYNKHIQLIDTVYMNVYEQNVLVDILKTRKPFTDEVKDFLLKYKIFTIERMTELINGMSEYIKTQELPSKKKWDKKVKVSFQDFMNVIFTYDKDGKFCSNEIILKKNAYKYITNNNRYKYIYNNEYSHKIIQPIADEELFNLFAVKPKNVRAKRIRSHIEPIIEPVVEQVADPVAETKPLLNLYTLNIEYIEKKDKIIETHLNYIVNYLERFTKLYEKYKSILVIKSYDKSYTKHKYFNFRFGKDKHSSKCFHVYLTDNLAGIVNITYIESIEMC